VKPSTLRHPVAVLRKICGLYQKEFADKIGCSRIYVQKIEQTPEHGGQKLSSKLAQRISHETGVSLDWLLGGDPSAPPVSAKGEPYTRDTYKKVETQRIYSDRPKDWYFSMDFLSMAGRLRSILANAAGRDRKRPKYSMAAYETRKFLDELTKEYGEDSTQPHSIDRDILAIEREIIRAKRLGVLVNRVKVLAIARQAKVLAAKQRALRQSSRPKPKRKRKA
jgi:transcriptional regulator with XRE-family HTH domain